MTGKARFRRGVHGAASVALAYAFLLQLLVAGFAAERMTFAAADEGHVFCAGATDPAAPDTGGEADKLTHCVICAFAAFAPILPERPGIAVPSAHAAAGTMALPAASPVSTSARYEPRSSQGPPAA